LLVLFYSLRLVLVNWLLIAVPLRRQVSPLAQVAGLRESVGLLLARP
jgi:hypothetical protein